MENTSTTYFHRSVLDYVVIFVFIPFAFLLLGVRWFIDSEFRALSIPITVVHIVTLVIVAALVRKVVLNVLEAVFATSDDGRSLERLLAYVPYDAEIRDLVTYLSQNTMSDTVFKSADATLLGISLSTNYQKAAKAISIVSAGLMADRRQQVLRIQTLLSRAKKSAKFSGKDKLSSILGVELSSLLFVPIVGHFVRKKTTDIPRWSNLSIQQKQAIYTLCVVSDEAHECVLLLFDFSDIPIEEEKAIVTAGLSDLPSGIFNAPSRFLAMAILNVMTSQKRKWVFGSKLLGGNLHDGSWVAMPSPLTRPDFELDSFKDRLTIGARMFALSMLITLTLLYVITPGRQIVNANSEIQSFLGITPGNSGFFVESLEHVLLLQYVSIFVVFLVTPLVMFVLLVREIGLVKINALDRDIDPFGVIVNRTIIRRLTTTGMLALASGVLIFFRQPGEQGSFEFLKSLSGVVQLLTAVCFPIGYACYANASMIPHVLRSVDDALYLELSKKGVNVQRYELMHNQNTMSVSMRIISSDDIKNTELSVQPEPTSANPLPPNSTLHDSSSPSSQISIPEFEISTSTESTQIPIPAPEARFTVSEHPHYQPSPPPEIEENEATEIPILPLQPPKSESPRTLIPLPPPPPPPNIAFPNPQIPLPPPPPPNVPQQTQTPLPPPPPPNILQQLRNHPALPDYTRVQNNPIPIPSTNPRSASQIGLSSPQGPVEVGSYRLDKDGIEWFLSESGWLFRRAGDSDWSALQYS